MKLGRPRILTTKERKDKNRLKVRKWRKENPQQVKKHYMNQKRLHKELHYMKPLNSSLKIYSNDEMNSVESVEINVKDFQSKKIIMTEIPLSFEEDCLFIEDIKVIGKGIVKVQVMIDDIIIMSGDSRFSTTTSIPVGCIPNSNIHIKLWHIENEFPKITFRKIKSDDKDSQKKMIEERFTWRLGNRWTIFYNGDIVWEQDDSRGKYLADFKRHEPTEEYMNLWKIYQNSREGITFPRSNSPYSELMGQCHKVLMETTTNAINTGKNIQEADKLGTEALHYHLEKADMMHQ